MERKGGDTFPHFQLPQCRAKYSSARRSPHVGCRESVCQPGVWVGTQNPNCVLREVSRPRPRLPGVRNVPESPVAAQTLLPPAAPCPGPQLKPPACHQPAVPAFPAHTELSGASAPPSSDPKLRPVFQESSPQAPAFPSRQPLAGPPDVT